jgi:hypothetical protein
MMHGVYGQARHYNYTRLYSIRDNYTERVWSHAQTYVLYRNVGFFCQTKKTGGEFLFFPPIIYLLPSTLFIIL